MTGDILQPPRRVTTALRDSFNTNVKYRNPPSPRRSGERSVLGSFRARVSRCQSRTFIAPSCRSNSSALQFARTPPCELRLRRFHSRKDPSKGSKLLRSRFRRFEFRTSDGHDGKNRREPHGHPEMAFHLLDINLPRVAKSSFLVARLPFLAILSMRAN